MNDDIMSNPATNPVYKEAVKEYKNALAEESEASMKTSLAWREVERLEALYFSHLKTSPQ